MFDSPYALYCKPYPEEFLAKAIKDVISVGRLELAKEVTLACRKNAHEYFDFEEPLLLSSISKGSKDEVQATVLAVLDKCKSRSCFGHSFTRCISAAIECCGKTLFDKAEGVFINKEGKAEFLVAAAHGFLDSGDKDEATNILAKALEFNDWSSIARQYCVHVRAALGYARMGNSEKAKSILDNMGLGEQAVADDFVELEERVALHRLGEGCVVPLFITLGDFDRAEDIANAFFHTLLASSGLTLVVRGKD